MIQLSGATFDFMDPLGLMHPKRKTTKKLFLYQKTVKTILQMQDVMFLVKKKATKKDFHWVQG